jgi:hypothetical protein
VVEHLLCKLKAWSSIPRLTERKRERERRDKMKRNQNTSLVSESPNSKMQFLRAPS